MYQSTPSSTAQRVADAMARFPEASADLAFLAADVIYPETPAARAAFSRQMLAALASFLHDPNIRHLAAALGSHSEVPGDLDRIAELGTRPVQHGEQALAGLMLDALTPSPRWNGLEGLTTALPSDAAARALVLVVAALPRTGGGTQ